MKGKKVDRVKSEDQEETGRDHVVGLVWVERPGAGLVSGRWPPG